MKKLVLSFFILFAAFHVSLAQNPLMGIPYQAVVSDSDGKVLANKSVSFRISFLRGSATGQLTYSEVHKVTSSAIGVVSFTLSKGTSATGRWLEVWQELHAYHLKVEMDKEGGNNFEEIGTSELQAVPYALYAFAAGPTYRVGDLAEGGMVIATWDHGRHGWVVALEDEAKDISWDDANLLIQADATGGYRDWVLPTIAQLELIYKLRNDIDGLTSLEYWSSSLISVLEYEASSFTVYNEEALLMVFNESLEDNGTVEEAPKCCRGKKSNGTAARAVRVF